MRKVGYGLSLFSFVVQGNGNPECPWIQRGWFQMTNHSPSQVPKFCSRPWWSKSIFREKVIRESSNEAATPQTVDSATRPTLTESVRDETNENTQQVWRQVGRIHSTYIQNISERRMSKVRVAELKTCRGERLFVGSALAESYKRCIDALFHFLARLLIFLWSPYPYLK